MIHLIQWNMTYDTYKYHLMTCIQTIQSYGGTFDTMIQLLVVEGYNYDKISLLMINGMLGYRYLYL